MNTIPQSFITVFAVSSISDTPFEYKLTSSGSENNAYQYTPFYYGSGTRQGSTIISKSLIHMKNPFKDVIQHSEWVRLSISDEQGLNTIHIIIHLTDINIQNHRLDFVSPSITGKIYVRQLHRFKNRPVEISGMHIKYNKSYIDNGPIEGVDEIGLVPVPSTNDDLIVPWK